MGPNLKLTDPLVVTSGFLRVNSVHFPPGSVGHLGAIFGNVDVSYKLASFEVYLGVVLMVSKCLGSYLEAQRGQRSFPRSLHDL